MKIRRCARKRLLNGRRLILVPSNLGRSGMVPSSFEIGACSSNAQSVVRLRATSVRPSVSIGRWDVRGHQEGKCMKDHHITTPHPCLSRVGRLPPTQLTISLNGVVAFRGWVYDVSAPRPGGAYYVIDGAQATSRVVDITMGYYLLTVSPSAAVIHTYGSDRRLAQTDSNIVWFVKDMSSSTKLINPPFPAFATITTLF